MGEISFGDVADGVNNAKNEVLLTNSSTTFSRLWIILGIAFHCGPNMRWVTFLATPDRNRLLATPSAAHPTAFFC